MEVEDSQAKRVFEAGENQKDRESQERIAEIRAQAMSLRGDADKDGIPDMLEVEKARQKGAIESKKLDLAQRKQSETERTNRATEEISRNKKNP